MSTFLAGPINNYMTISARYNNERIHNNDYRRIPSDIRDGVTAQYMLLWPRSDFAGGSDQAGYLSTAHQLWDTDDFRAPTGTHRRKVISGVTRNTDGSVNGGVTVKLFNTATGLLVDSTVSDAAGNYTLTDPNGVACFIVAYEAGSPDVSGTTVNTLTGV